MKQNYRKHLSLFLLSFLVLPFQNCGAFKPSAGYNYKSSADSSSLGTPVPEVPSVPGTPGTPVVGPVVPPQPVPIMPPDPSDAGRRILKVCASGCDYTVPSDAVNAAMDNDIIEIQAGSYNNCFGLTKNNIKIRGVGGRAHFTGAMCQGKGAIVYSGRNLVVENLEFSNFYVADQNGAGIRHQGVGLIVRNSYFHNGENGILSESATPGSADDTVLIENCKFDHDGGGGGYAHAVYFGHHSLVTIKNSVFLSSHEGHEYKSRAHANTIDCSVYASLDGDDSYTLNFPEAGNVSITNTTVEQGPGSVNSGIIDYGSESITANTVNTFVASNILVINDLGRGSFFSVQKSTNFEVKNSVLVGAGTPYGGVQSATETAVTKQADRTAANIAPYPALPTSSACTGKIGLLY